MELSRIGIDKVELTPCLPATLLHDDSLVVQLVLHDGLILAMAFV